MKKHSSKTAQTKHDECVYGAFCNKLTDFIIFRDTNLFLTLKYIAICFSVLRPSLVNFTMCGPTEKVSERCLGSVGSETHLSLMCNYVLKNNYMFRPMMAIVRLFREYLRIYCKLYRAHNVKISICLVSKTRQGTNKSNQKKSKSKSKHSYVKTRINGNNEVRHT